MTEKNRKKEEAKKRRNTWPIKPTSRMESRRSKRDKILDERKKKGE